MSEQIKNTKVRCNCNQGTGAAKYQSSKYGEGVRICTVRTKIMPSAPGKYICTVCGKAHNSTIE